MILIEYPGFDVLPQSSSWDHKYNGPNPQHKARGRMKIPQTYGLVYDEDNPTDIANNNNWRKEYHTFTGGGVYSVAQFYPTKTFQPYLVKENRFGDVNRTYVAGQWFKTAGNDSVTQSALYDNQNYIIKPSSGTTFDPEFKYDFSPNIITFGNSEEDIMGRWFGGQWLNFTLCFPQLRMGI